MITKEDLEELENRFTYHKPDVKQTEQYQILRSTAKALAALIMDTTPDSREKALAITKLEEAVFWANAAIARRS